MELRIRFLYLNFFLLAPNQMVLISKSWEGENVFFNVLDHDLTLWEALLLDCQSFSIFYYKLCKLITFVIASLLMQSLKLGYHPKVPNSSTPGFQNFQQLFITPIFYDVCHLLPPLINNVVVTYIFPCLPMTMFWCLL